MLESAAQLRINRARIFQVFVIWQQFQVKKMADSQLDATGMKCPIPVLKARKIVRGLTGGSTLEILATDPGSVPDFEAFCATGGHELLEHSREGEVFRFL